MRGDVMDKLSQILSLCKCSVYLTIDEHKSYYESVEEFLTGRNSVNEVDSEVLKKMIELDKVIDLQFYPNTPVGCYRLLHYDLDMCLYEGLKCLINV
jgi:hypothetical protein